MENLLSESEGAELDATDWKPDPELLELLKTGTVRPGSSLERALAYVPPLSGGFHVTQQTGVCARTRLPIDERVYFMNHDL